MVCGEGSPGRFLHDPGSLKASRTATVSVPKVNRGRVRHRRRLMKATLNATLARTVLSGYVQNQCHVQLRAARRALFVHDSDANQR